MCGAIVSRQTGRLNNSTNYLLHALMTIISKKKGTHLCNLCVDTRWLAHVLRDRPDDSHGKGGLLQVGGPVADALWSHGFKVALLTLCLFVSGKQK